MNSLVFVAVCVLATVSAQQQRYPQILKLSNDVGADGQFQYAYQTEDGISAEARGSLVGGSARSSQDSDGPATAVTGQYSYTGPDGQVYTVSYVADENGYRASGAHLPQPHPIPEAIQKSLQVTSQSSFQAQPQTSNFQRSQTFTSFQQPQSFQARRF
ncbi:Cuticle Protein CPR RR-1 7 [Frankliniella occidentalis]|uniref:Endocuticle structural glycoprotein SgAbd-2-like n=1 Tax=Frankliniella occidentalis TaxID=133901 RepID=A0A6J1S1H9_FRAOC|nr:endocuticle structural glycoprotein SgAbd-2-like [Frankliniella occidentalis]KAE8741959.1 Cuticle Protein CPR RR-1 7 [Frankliniella occidentalis]